MGFGHAESALLDLRNKSNQTVAFFLRALNGFRFYQFHDTSPEGPLRRDRCEIWNYRPFHGNGGNLPAVLFRLKSASPENWHLLIRTIRLVAPFFRDFVFQKESGRSSEGDVLLSWAAEGQDYA
ncbi:hypothetical protein, partial [Escherichia coli]|uniref:hypothetical protein n=1 Tax=Escherichia coli TaxID=562 RepID=UPI001EFD385A